MLHPPFAALLLEVAAVAAVAVVAVAAVAVAVRILAQGRLV